MVVQKVGFLALLLLFGTFLLVSKVQHADAKPCTRECDGRIAYAICPRLGINNKIKQLCTNCCAGFKGCNYYSADGKFICEGESEYVSNKVENGVGKACTLECDTRIAFGICPLASGNKRIHFDRICTNCCAGKKGCNYFSEDGTFICEGESEYVSNKVENGVGKACTLECDPRIAFGFCYALGNKRISFDRICTNCCAGKKGCNYYSADGTFICEGESKYVSKEENDLAVA